MLAPVLAPVVPGQQTVLLPGCSAAPRPRRGTRVDPSAASSTAARGPDHRASCSVDVHYRRLDGGRGLTVLPSCWQKAAAPRHMAWQSRRPDGRTGSCSRSDAAAAAGEEEGSFTVLVQNLQKRPGLAGALAAGRIRIWGQNRFSAPGKDRARTF